MTQCSLLTISIVLRGSHRVELANSCAQKARRFTKASNCSRWVHHTIKLILHISGSNRFVRMPVILAVGLTWEKLL